MIISAATIKSSNQGEKEAHGMRGDNNTNNTVVQCITYYVVMLLMELVIVNISLLFLRVLYVMSEK
jgi:hypothetical protein